MNIYKKLLLVATLLACTVIPAMAEQDPLYQQVGNWGVYVDKALDGCYILTGFPQSGTSFRYGTNRPAHEIYFILFDPAWTSMQPGATYLLAVHFGNEKLFQFHSWTGRVVVLEDNMRALYLALPDWPTVRSALLDEADILIMYQDHTLLHAGIAGSRAALLAQWECVRSHGSRDPFKAP